jgi:hypothetical protein
MNARQVAKAQRDTVKLVKGLDDEAWRCCRLALSSLISPEGRAQETHREQVLSEAAQIIRDIYGTYFDCDQQKGA